MDILTPPVVSLFDAAMSGLAAAFYIAAALIAIARAPRDTRTWMFFVIAVTSAPAYLAQVFAWRYGSAALGTRELVVPLLVSMSVSSVALFHFAQVFPWNRPWIVRHPAWLAPAYILAPAIVLGLGWFAPETVDTATIPYLLAAVALGFPAILLVGILLPFAGLVSLYKTYLAAKRHAVERARVPIIGIFTSQIAGGLLGVLFVPLLHVIAPTGPWEALTAGALFAFGMLMPAAFVLGVIGYDVLALDPMEGPEGL
jgi:hypothetical protein